MELIKITDPAPLRSPHHDKPIAYDVRYLPDGTPKPVIIFVHGFKGFKDWGYFNLMADTLAQSGFFYVKLNLSHNGTSPAHPTEFVDLEAFGHNTFSTELDDLEILIDHLQSPNFSVSEQEFDLNRLFLIGHSRGGSLVLLKAYEDSRVKAAVTLAAVSDLEARWPPEHLAQWKQTGVHHVQNSRTGQTMPLYYDIAEDFYTHRERLDVPTAVRQLGKPLLVFHGSDDETVPVQSAYDIQEWNGKAQVEIIPDANHVFGGQHPYDSHELPADVKRVVAKTTEFLKGINVG